MKDTFPLQSLSEIQMASEMQSSINHYPHCSSAESGKTTEVFVGWRPQSRQYHMLLSPTCMTGTDVGVTGVCPASVTPEGEARTPATSVHLQSSYHIPFLASIPTQDAIHEVFLFKLKHTDSQSFSISPAL